MIITTGTGEHRVRAMVIAALAAILSHHAQASRTDGAILLNRSGIIPGHREVSTAVAVAATIAVAVPHAAALLPAQDQTAEPEAAINYDA